jgi:hypothetical protein
VAGLALSIGLGACLNASLLYWGLRRNNIYRPQPGWLMFCVKLVIACGLMGAAACSAPSKSTGSACKQHAFLRMGAAAADRRVRRGLLCRAAGDGLPPARLQAHRALRQRRRTKKPAVGRNAVQLRFRFRTRTV